LYIHVGAEVCMNNALCAFFVCDDGCNVPHINLIANSLQILIPCSWCCLGIASRPARSLWLMTETELKLCVPDIS